MTDFANRHQVEEHLAEQAEGGVIVEIGGGYGNGAIALAHGTATGRKLPIFIVDPYQPYTDRLGGEYGPDTLREFEANLTAAGVRDKVTHIQKGALDAAHDWTQPIALLWLDLTMDYAELKVIFDAWSPHIVDGGYVGITGAEYTQIGTGRVAREALGLGYEPLLEDQRFVAVLRKSNIRRAVFYICNDGDGGRFVREAICSARSAQHYLRLPCFLFLAGNVNEDTSAFDRVYSLPAQRGPFWYLDSTRYFNQAVAELSDYHQLLYLDVDTHVCCPCSEMFILLQNFDMAIGLSASRDAIESALGTPASFSTRQIGVNLFRNDEWVRAFLAYWLELYERHWRIYDNNDEAPMRDALYTDKNLHWVGLPPEYCLRFDFGAWVVGKVRILHGRRGGISTDRASLAEVADEINSHTGMRIWNHGLLR